MSGYQNKRYGGGGGGGGGSQQYNNQNSRHQFYDVSEIVCVNKLFSCRKILSLDQEDR